MSNDFEKKSLRREFFSSFLQTIRKQYPICERRKRKCRRILSNHNVRCVGWWERLGEREWWWVVRAAFSPRDLINETKAHRRRSYLTYYLIRTAFYSQSGLFTRAQGPRCISLRTIREKQREERRRDASTTRCVTHRLLNRRSCPRRSWVRYRSPENTYTWLTEETIQLSYGRGKKKKKRSHSPRVPARGVPPSRSHANSMFH